MEATQQLSGTEKDGIVVVSGTIPKPTDIYHIESTNQDVLVLEICKLQSSKDEIIGCLTAQQERLSNGMGHSFCDLAKPGFIMFGTIIFTVVIVMLANATTKMIMGRN